MTDLVPLRTNIHEIDEDGNLIRVLTPEGEEFIITPERLALFQDENGEWLEGDAWPWVPAIMICHSPSCFCHPDLDKCHMNGVWSPTKLPENVDGVFRTWCGPCSTPHGLYEDPEGDTRWL